MAVNTLGIDPIDVGRVAINAGSFFYDTQTVTNDIISESVGRTWRVQ